MKITPLRFVLLTCTCITEVVFQHFYFHGYITDNVYTLISTVYNNELGKIIDGPAMYTSELRLKMLDKIPGFSDRLLASRTYS